MIATNGPPNSEWFDRIAQASGLNFFVLRVQPDLAFEFASSAVTQSLGIPVPGETEADAVDVLSRTSAEHADRLAEILALPPGQQTSVDLNWRHVDGRPVFSRTLVQSRKRSDGSVILEGVVQDITELRRVEAELIRSEERHRLLAENAWEVVWTISLDGSITYISPAVEQSRGLTPAQARRQTPEEINTPESAARIVEYYQRVFAAIEAGTEPPAFRGELDYYRIDGSIMAGELQVIPHLDAAGRVVELIGVTRDISDRKMFEAELTRLATTDPVTGVWNRHHGADRLVAATTQADRDHRQCSVLMLDIDDFKAINDSFGHPAGDQVLVELARRLGEAVRSTDTVVRWGGEEFVILLGDCPLDNAVARAEEIRNQIAGKAFPVVGAVTVSIGVAQLTAGEESTSWLGRADEALYQAKRSGRNTVAFA
jgi:diguanylate cyclase (GGDEF)-like protein/PAS domain S-box-containing protein